MELTLLLALIGALAVGLLLGGLIGALWSRSTSPDDQTLTALTNRITDDAVVAEGLARLGDQLRDLEHARASWQGQFNAQVAQLRDNNEGLRRETAALSTALRRPHVRGQWGELHLRRAVELAGLVDRCDFSTQVTTGVTTTGATPGSSSGSLRPDLVVHLAGGRDIVVDSKVPLDAFLDAQTSTDDDARDRHLRRHVSQLKAHVTALSAKRYTESFDHAPEFVVMFLPAEAFLAAALDTDPALLEYAADRGIILATPTTLIALLRTVAQGWTHQRLADQALEVRRLGRELHDRLQTMSDSLGRVGRALSTAVSSYNQAVGSLERRVLVSARRFQDLGVVDRPLTGPECVDLLPRGVEQPDPGPAAAPTLLDPAARRASGA